jgi:hypothetical protein
MEQHRRLICTFESELSLLPVDIFVVYINSVVYFALLRFFLGFGACIMKNELKEEVLIVERAKSCIMIHER